MNEQIQALAEEAEIYADAVVDQGGEFHEAYTKKLSELIIERCCDAAWDAASSDESAEEVTDAIRAAFGVEE